MSVMQSARPREALVVGGIFLTALLLRLLHLQQLLTNDPRVLHPGPDSALYHRWASALADGSWSSNEVFFNAPAYPYFLSLLYRITGPSIPSVLILQLVLGSINCGLLYLLARLLLGARVGLLAGLMAACYSMFIFFEGNVLICNLQLTLTLLLLLLLHRAREKQERPAWLFAGVCLGLSIITRPNTLLLLPLLLAWLIFIQVRRLPPTRLVQLVLLFCTGTALVVAPVTLRNMKVAGDLVLVNSNGGINFYIGNNPQARGFFFVPPLFHRSSGDSPEKQRYTFKFEAEKRLGRNLKDSEVSSYWYGQGLDYITSQPLAWLKLVGRKLALFCNDYEIWDDQSFYFSRQFSWVLRLPLLRYGIILPLAIVGMIFSLRQWRRLLGLYAVLATYLATALMFTLAARYRLPVVPVLIVFAAAGCFALRDQIGERRWSALGVSALVVALLLGVAFRDPHVTQADFVNYYNLGIAYKMEQQWEQARDAMLACAERRPGFVAAHSQLAQIYEERPEWRKLAIDRWQKVWLLARKQGLRNEEKQAIERLNLLRSGGSEY